MAQSAIVDPKPSDYREAHLCAAYLAPPLMEEHRLRAGDVIRISTERGRSALARILGPLPEDATGTIRFDRLIRQSLKAYPHDRVSIEQVDPGPARQVVLVPGIDISMLHISQLVSQVKAALTRDETPLREGMLLYARLGNGLAGITYDVHSVSDVEGLVTAETQIHIEVDENHEHGEQSHRHEHARQAETVLDTTYEDVGGLEQQVRAIREFVELPLLFPQVYRQLGIAPPRGVIFHGAPGTGKTLLARSVANEINARFYYINGPEIVGTYSGQTEENLRKVFAEAGLNPPAIVFFDELDAIAPARRTASTLSDSRAVTQLLSLMDGLKHTEGVMVIGTTNRLEAIEMALRRAGRFDREVHFPTPSASAREEILRIHTREMPLSEEALAALPAIAQRAYGFVGADLMELAREAGLNALRRAAQRFVASPSPASYPASEELVVSREDFQHALAQVHPAALRESLISFPTVRWSDVGGLAEAKKRLRDLVETPLRHPDLFARLGLPTNVGVLLYGPSGTGKTLLARAVACESGANFVAIQGPEVYSQWLGESEEAVREIFRVARRAAPSVIFFDQLDAIAPRRRGWEAEGTRAPQRVLSQLLSELDGMEPLSYVVVIGASNDLSALDPAVLRPGRFGVHVSVGLPDASERAEILDIHLRGTALAPGVERERLIADVARRSKGLSGADLAALCQAAKLRALDQAQYAGEPALRRAHLEAALMELRAPEPGASR